MEFIAHRINTVEELKQIPLEYGVEIDLRDYKDELILQHDPFLSGEKFKDFLMHYSHGTLILNIKSERIEYKVLELIKKYNIEKYFFLDSTFPMIYLLSEKLNENNIAIRFSEFEKLDTVIEMQNKIKWVWVDCFTQLPINKEIFRKLKKCNFNLCLVSPELQGREEDIKRYKEFLKKEEIVFDAICTKIYNIKEWKQNG